MLGAGGDADRAIAELELALQHEPYDDARARVRLAIDLLEGRA